MKRKKVNESNYFQGQLNKMAKRFIFKGFFAGMFIALGIGCTKGAIDELSVMDSLKSLGELNLPEEVVDALDEKKS